MISLSRFLIKTGSKLLNTPTLFRMQSSYFGAKIKDGSKSDREVDKSKKSVSGGGATASDSERGSQTIKIKQAAQQTEAKAQKTEQQPEVNITTEQSNDTGVVKRIDTVPGNKPPASDDSVGGRYAVTLFTVASQENNLFNVYEDMKYINQLYENIENFRIFAVNSGLNSSQINSFVAEMGKCGNFCATTLKFCDLVGKNKRFMYINEIAKKYIRTYLMLAKEEKITIISAQELTATEKDDVKNALMSNPNNEGKTFIIDYSVNSSIIGGLQMYTENKFMDLSLSSRLEKIKDEVNKLI